MAIRSQQVRRRIVRCLALAGLAAAVATGLSAAPEPVRELARSGQTVTLGNASFRVTVEPTGTLRDLRVGDTQLISFIALYTSPVPPETDKDVRGCQAETPGLGDRPSEVNLTFTEGAAQLIITRVCSHPLVLNNEPLWRLRETISLSPEGVLNLRYGCAFDRLLRWQGFRVATALTMDAVRGRPLQSFVPNLTLATTVPDSLPTRDEASGLMGARVETTAGPMRLWFGGASRVEVLNWTEYLTFLAPPTALPYAHMTVYRNTRADLSVEIHLPVN